MTIKAQVSTLGPDHPVTLACRSNLALAYYSAGRRSDAINLYESTIKAQESTLGPDHPGTRKTRAALMRRYYETGLFERALPFYLHEYQSALGAHGPQHISTLLASRDLGEIYARLRRYDQAEPLFLEALAGLEDRPGTDPIVVLTKRYLANMYAAQGRFAQVQQVSRGTRDCDKKDKEAKCRTRPGSQHGPSEADKP